MTASYPPSEPLTLEFVKSQFSQWRASHGKGNKLPPALWNAVKELTKSYSYHQISSELKISPSRLRKKCGLPGAQRSTSSPFVQVPLPPLSAASLMPIPSEQKYHACAGTIEITRKDGTILKVSGLENKSLLSVMHEFLKP